ncbi:MAG TPA: outer membrane beta-barrel protein [Bacteroidales bacterium]|nr:outer membrane beta-barrel protein [Bacteroidales bacterium]HPR73372.1 outer membrane beta-barrel protein [Bacteroidales bacterium]
MKKTTLFLLLIIATTPLMKAQVMKAGGGLAYGSGFYFNNYEHSDYRSGHIAAFLTGSYEINDMIHISPSFTVFFPNITKSGDDYKMVISSAMFDINGHYVFNYYDNYEFYGLAGLNILMAWEKTKAPGIDVFRENDNALGLNIGAGTLMKVTDQFDFFVEAKYIISKYDQFMFNAGVLFNIDWLINNEASASD